MNYRRHSPSPFSVANTDAFIPLQLASKMAAAGGGAAVAYGAQQLGGQGGHAPGNPPYVS